MEKNSITFPTEPDKDGFFFDTDDDHELGILTRNYDNGSAIKKLTLSNGACAIVKKLRGRDFVETKKRVQNDNTLDFETANMSVAVEVDGKPQPPEYYLNDLFQSDYSKLLAAYSILNFQ